MIGLYNYMTERGPDTDNSPGKGHRSDRNTAEFYTIPPHSSAQRSLKTEYKK